MSEKISIIILVVIFIIFVFPRFFLYTPSGDISNFYNKEISNYSSISKLLESLYKSSILPYSKVLWHYNLVLSLFCSFLFLYIFNILTSRNLIICVLLFFVIIEIPNRFISSHYNSINANYSTSLYSILKDRLNYIK